MPIRPAAVAALALLAVAAPAAAQDAASDTPAAAAGAAQPDAAPCAQAHRKGPGLGALLSAANQAGAADLLSGRSGAFMGSGKHGIAGAVLGGALGAAGSDGSTGAYGGLPMTPAGGSRKAQIAAVAAGAVVSLARSQATSSACSSH